MVEIAKETVFVAASDQVSAELTSDFAGDAVVLDLNEGVYYELNEVASRVWSLLEQPISVGSVLDVLLDEYDVPPERCERDLRALLQDLLSRGLIERQ